MNPGACHYYIHAVEKVKPALAVPCAERLAALMPAAGHLVHMPAHIYARVGRYNDAVDANVHAVHADGAFIADRPGQHSVYTTAYYPHNYHFFAFAAALAGRSQEAINAATAASENTPVEVALLAVEAEYVVPARFVYLAEVRPLGRYPGTPASSRYPARRARHGALCPGQRARGEGPRRGGGGGPRHGGGPREGRAGRDPEAAAGHFRRDARGEHRAAAGQYREVEIAAYQRAATAEDGLPYMEPAFWHHPTRLALGAALLKAHRAKEAAVGLSRRTGPVSREW